MASMDSPKSGRRRVSDNHKRPPRIGRWSGLVAYVWGDRRQVYARKLDSNDKSDWLVLKVFAFTFEADQSYLRFPLFPLLEN